MVLLDSEVAFPSSKVPFFFCAATETAVTKQPAQQVLYRPVVMIRTKGKSQFPIVADRQAAEVFLRVKMDLECQLSTVWG